MDTIQITNYTKDLHWGFQQELLWKKQWLRTLFQSYRGFTIIKDVAKESPDIKDAQLPIGIVEYFAGISSPLISWAVRLYDLEPSTESGINKIALAADEGHWSWIEAKAILSNLYLWVENDPILALEHAKDLAIVIFLITFILTYCIWSLSFALMIFIYLK